MLQQQPSGAMACSRKLGLDLNRHALDLEHSSGDGDGYGYGYRHQDLVGAGGDGAGESRREESASSPPHSSDGAIHGMYANPLNLHHHHHRHHLHLHRHRHRQDQDRQGQQYHGFASSSLPSPYPSQLLPPPMPPSPVQHALPFLHPIAIAAAARFWQRAGEGGECRSPCLSISPQVFQEDLVFQPAMEADFLQHHQKLPHQIFGLHSVASAATAGFVASSPIPPSQPLKSEPSPPHPSPTPHFAPLNRVKIERDDEEDGIDAAIATVSPSICSDSPASLDSPTLRQMRSGSQQLPHSPSHMPTFERLNNVVKIEEEDGARHGVENGRGAIAPAPSSPPSACPDRDLLNAQRMRSSSSIASQQLPHSPYHIPTFKRSNNAVKIEEEDGARHDVENGCGAIAPAPSYDLDLLNAQRMRPSGSIVSQQLPHSPSDLSTFERLNNFVKIEKEERARYGGDDVFGDGEDDTRSSLLAMDSETPSPSAGDVIIIKFTVESPAWLPDGWVTEVQTRQTGTSAGTKDKYFKDLISGRRFRSRNEVLHFLKTGKGRPQKRQKKVIRSIDGASTEIASMSAATASSDFNQRLKCTEASPYMPPCQQGTDFVANPTMNTHPCQKDMLANNAMKTNLGYVSLPQSNPAPVFAPVTEEILSPPSMDAHPSHVSFPQPQPAPTSAPVAEEISVSSSMNMLPSHVSYIQPQPAPVSAPLVEELPLSSSMNTHPSHVSFPQPPPAAMAAPVTEELPSSSLKQVDVLPTSTTAEPPISPITLKRISPQESPQKLLSKKKPKMISSPNDAVNKQASRLWQWLQKPAPNEPQVSAVNSNAETLVTQLPAGLERSMEGLERGIQAAQKTVHLGIDLLSAQRTVMKLGREMQASVERLSRGIQAVQRTAKTSIESTFSDDFALDTEFQSNQRANEAMCNAVQAAQTIDSAIEKVMQAAESIDDAMESIIQASQKLDVAMGNVIQASQVSETSMNTTPQIGEMSNNASQRFDSSTSTCNEFHIPPRSHVIQGSQKLDVAMGNVIQASQVSETSMTTTPQIGEMSNNASQRFDSSTSTCNVLHIPPRSHLIQGSQKLDVAMGNVIQASQVSETSTTTTPQIGEMSNNASQRFDSSTSTCTVLHIPPRSHDSKKELLPTIENGIPGTLMPNLELPFPTQGFPMFAMGNGFYTSEGHSLVTNKVYPSTQMTDGALMFTETRASFIPVHVMGNGMKTELLPVVAVGIVGTQIQPMPQITPVANPVVIQPPFQVPLVNSMSYQIPNNNMSALVDDKHTKTPIKAEDVALTTQARPMEQMHTPESSSPEEIKQIVEVKPRDGSCVSIMYPQFDLTTICLNMSSHQRVKVKQRLKARYIRCLLAFLGRQLCVMALRKDKTMAYEGHHMDPFHKTGMKSISTSAQELALYEVLKDCQQEFSEFSESSDDESDGS